MCRMWAQERVRKPVCFAGHRVRIAASIHRLHPSHTGWHLFPVSETPTGVTFSLPSQTPETVTCDIFSLHIKLQKPSHLTPFPLFLESPETVTCDTCSLSSQTPETVTCNLFSPTPPNSQTTETVIALLCPPRASWMSYLENVIFRQIAQTVN